MEIACVVSGHDDVRCTLDTVESVQTYVTPNVMLFLEETAWPQFRNASCSVPIVKGFRHRVPKSPYRNVALALSTLVETHPDVDWYCYCEYDVLFGSERFKHNLRMAEEKGVWMLGNDGRIDNAALPLVQAMLDKPIKSSYYLLGCCLFFHRHFMLKLKEIDFFDRFLMMTSGFEEGTFPLYLGWDVSEHLYPTLCRHFGGNVGVFAHYDEEGTWHGAYRYFPVRWRPELDPETESFPEASILHPLKSYDHPVRELHRKRREAWKVSQTKERPSESSSTSPLPLVVTEDDEIMSCDVLSPRLYERS